MKSGSLYAGSERMNDQHLIQKAWEILSEVPDPEIPMINIVDLGMVGNVQADNGSLRIELLPTFIGCPAVEVIHASVTARLAESGMQADVSFSYDPPWTSDRITESGRSLLRQAGFAPPPVIAPPPAGLIELSTIELVECPYCSSRNTTLENLFGPTLCRAIYHCADCRQPFEKFKAI